MADSSDTPTWRPRPSPSLPNEHGFWVMLAAPALATWLRVGLTPATALTSALVLGSFVVGAALVHRQVRRSPRLQLGLAVSLGLVAAPLELSGGASVRSALAVSGAWMAIFLSTTLIVRATFARAARGGAARATRLRVLAVAAPGLASVGFALAGRFQEAAACATATLTCALLAGLKPGVKQLKQVGLSLAASVVVCAAALAS